MRKRIDMTGQRFGKLVAVEYIGRDEHGKTRWRCQCDCGKTTTPTRSELIAGKAKSCGCSRIDRPPNLKHGQSYSATYSSWSSMWTRCSNERVPKFGHYGGRGITICERWQKFENFLADMGQRPVGKTLDRINPDGNYEPTNCRWATPLEQTHNRRKK